MYVVVDTSVLIAAFLKPGQFADTLIQEAYPKGYLICLSESILAELRAKLERRDVAHDQVERFLRLLRTTCAVCDDADYTADEIARDDHVVGCYRRCRANLIVTNDKALIRRLKREDIATVRPSEFQAYLS